MKIVFPCIFSPIPSPLTSKLKRAKPDWHFADPPHHENFASSLRFHFVAGVPIVVIGSVAIAIRILSPLIKSKYTEPPLVSISPDGKHVIPLLGGHHGGNDLAEEIAQVLDSQAIISNVSSLGNPLSAIAHDWHVVNPKDLDALYKLQSRGEKVEIRSDCFAANLSLPSMKEGDCSVTVTDKIPATSTSGVIVHPPTLTLGMGFVRNADVGEVIDFTEKALERHGIALQSIAGIASIEVKRFEPALHGIANRLGVPVRVFDVATLAEVHKVYDLADNAVVFDVVGVHSVAEASALALADSGGVHDSALVVQKEVHSLATLAVASANEAIDLADLEMRGLGCGKLHVIGLGPGDGNFLTVDAMLALHECSLIVGYSLYIDLIDSYISGKEIHSFPLGKERERVEKALLCVEEGHTVGLVCSGDAGIYAMASLVFEELDSSKKRLPVIVHPGISAMVMASSRFGAILGHDFCAVSLSDLLTPREVIISRILNAVRGDFVIAFYNPQSLGRRSLLPEAISIIKEHRNLDTPIVVARNLTRLDERLTRNSLGDFCSEQVDMLSIVMVGNSQSRLLDDVPLCGGGIVYTPRGY